MRGKKYDENMLKNIYENMIEQNILEQMPAKERQFLLDLSNAQNNGLDKRTPGNGFMGMRGKKFFDDELENIQNEVKRVPNGGFMGMRGKKSVDNNDFYSSDKRAPQGFMGKKYFFNI